MSAVIVIACYRPKPGQADALAALVRTHVPRLRSAGLVTDRAPTAMAASDGTIVEVFEWKSQAAIDRAHALPEVRTLWQEFERVCEYVPVASVPGANELFSGFTPLS